MMKGSTIAVGFLLLASLSAHAKSFYRLHPAVPVTVERLELPLPKGFTWLEFFPCRSGGRPLLGAAGTHYEIRKWRNSRPIDGSATLFLGGPASTDGAQIKELLDREWKRAASRPLGGPVDESALRIEGATARVRTALLSDDDGETWRVLSAIIVIDARWYPIRILGPASAKEWPTLLHALRGARVLGAVAPQRHDAPGRDPFVCNGGDAPGASQ